MKRKILIKEDVEYSEFCVPAESGSDDDGYYTSELEDAIQTCYAIHGSDVDVYVCTDTYTLKVQEDES